MGHALLLQMLCKVLAADCPAAHVRAGAALADQIVGSKAYRNHACTLAMVAVALAQFVVTGLLPLSSDLFFILGASHITPATEWLQNDMQIRAAVGTGRCSGPLCMSSCESVGSPEKDVCPALALAAWSG